MFSRCFIKQHPTSILPPFHPHRHHKSRLLPSPVFIKAATRSKDCFLGTKSFWSLEALFSVVRLNRYLTQLLRSCNELEEILRRPVSKPLLPLPWPGRCVWGCDLPGALMMVGSWSSEVPEHGWLVVVCQAESSQAPDWSSPGGLCHHYPVFRHQW